MKTYTFKEAAILAHLSRNRHLPEEERERFWAALSKGALKIAKKLV